MAASFTDHQQQRGAAWDVVDEALLTYDDWMLDDDYEFDVILKKIMNRMRERRDAYRTETVPDDAKTPQT